MQSDHIALVFPHESELHRRQPNTSVVHLRLHTVRPSKMCTRDLKPYFSCGIHVCHTKSRKFSDVVDEIKLALERNTNKLEGTKLVDLGKRADHFCIDP